MASRLKLQEELERILGSRNVYYQPPATLIMNYPAIVYSKTRPDVVHADNKTYLKTNRYDVTVISKKPDIEAIDKILELPLSDYDRHYISDNLHHDVISLYY